MWPRDAYVGQKVVPYRNGGHPLSKKSMEHSIPENITLTISWVGIVQYCDGVVIDFIEYPFGPKIPGFYFGYDALCFRPVQSTSTGYAILAKLQNPQNCKELIHDPV